MTETKASFNEFLRHHTSKLPFSDQYTPSRRCLIFAVKTDGAPQRFRFSMAALFLEEAKLGAARALAFLPTNFGDPLLCFEGNTPAQ